MHRPGEAVQLLRGDHVSRAPRARPRVCLEELAGRLVELSGDAASATLTFTIGLRCCA